MILFFISLHRDNQTKQGTMKYRELERLVSKAGCYDTGRQQAGHPLWLNPKTGETFQMSNHQSQEVATGTLRKIMRAAGI